MATDYTALASCMGAWLFDIGDSSPWDDESGEGNELIESASAPTPSTDRPSIHTGDNGARSMDFDDANSQRLYCAHADLSNGFPGKSSGLQDWMYAFWYKPDDLGDEAQAIMGKYDSWRINLDGVGGWPPDDLYFYHYDSGWTAQGKYLTIAASVETWYHIVLSFNGDGTNTVCTAWVSTESSFGDVVDANEQTMSGVGDLNSSQATAFEVGSHNSALYFDGHIYQPIIFNDDLLAIANALGKTGTDAEKMSAVAEEIYTYGIDGVSAGAAGSSIVPMIAYYQRRRR